MSDHLAATLRRKTIPGILVERARAQPDDIALRSKHRGLYRERSWRDLTALVSRCSQALAGLGLERGERLAIMADASEEWPIVDLAAQACGAITYGIYPTSSVAEVAYQIAHGGARMFVAGDQEHVDKLLAAEREHPAATSIATIIVIDATGMFDYRDERIVRWPALIGADDLNAEALVTALESRIQPLKPEDPAFIVYTSGTTGHPKGALVTHGKHLAGAATLIDTYPLLAETAQTTVAYLPLCHVLGRDIAITLPLLSRLVPHFGESVDDLASTLFEVAPTVLFAVPRVLQKIAAQVLVDLANTSPLKRRAYDAAMRVARSYAAARWNGHAPTGATLAYQAAHALALRPILNKIGFDQLQLVVSGGAPLAPETMALWQMWGVNVCEIYGQTETAGAIIAGQRGPFPRPGDVGTVPSGWEVRLAGDTREILVKGPDIFERYWQDPEGTHDVVDPAGWLHTGDSGEWVDPDNSGRLRLIDRVRDFIVTAGGKTLSPATIENILRASPYVAEAIVIGHGRKYLTALIEVEFDALENWARNNDVRYAGYTSLVQHADVVALIDAEVRRANEALARVETIKTFRILPRALDPEAAEDPVTPTRKVKRAQLIERFLPLVESMYDDREARLVAQASGDVR